MCQEDGSLRYKIPAVHTTEALLACLRRNTPLFNLVPSCIVPRWFPLAWYQEHGPVCEQAQIPENKAPSSASC